MKQRRLLSYQPEGVKGKENPKNTVVMSPKERDKHNNKQLCQAGKLSSSEEIAYINNTLYSTADKVTQDAMLLSYMDIKAVQRRRPKVRNPDQSTGEDPSLFHESVW